MLLFCPPNTILLTPYQSNPTLMFKITRLLFSIALLSFTLVAQGQVKIGENPTEIHPKALLQLESTSKVLLLPRLTTQQRDNALDVVSTLPVRSSLTPPPENLRCCIRSKAPPDEK